MRMTLKKRENFEHQIYNLTQRERERENFVITMLAR